jgi:hypothetical protein
MVQASPMNSEISALAALAARAQSHRDNLKLRFGLTDHAIDVMLQARQQKKPNAPPYLLHDGRPWFRGEEKTSGD